MKKLLPALAAAATLGVAGATIYHFRPPAGAGAGGAAARFLPAETALLLSLPDPMRVAADWKTTDLYQIGQEPEVQAFLAKPLSKAPVPKELTGWLEKAARLQPRRLFVALTALDEKNNQPHVVAGFEFTGTPAEVDQLLAAPREQLRKRFPAGRADLLNYQGHPVETFDAGEGNFLASVYVGSRYLVSNDLALLKATVDRIESRAAGTPALDQEPDFRAATAKMPADPATLIFARPQAFTRRLFDLLAASGQAVSDEQRAEAAKVKALAATTRIEHGKLRDTLYTLAPGHRRAPAALQRQSLALTTADTLLYAAGLFNVPERLDMPPGTGGAAALSQLAAALRQQGVTPESFRAAFGQELALQLDWPASSAQPAPLASLEVRDRAAAAKLTDSLVASTPGWQPVPANGLKLYTWTSPELPVMLAPALALTNRHLLLGLNAADVQAAAAREQAPAANFTISEAYKTVAAGVQPATTGFAYLDARTLFERAYGVLKPLATFGAVMSPRSFQAVDLNKLPGSESIARHLSPMILSSSEDEQGALVESVGPLTFINAGAGLFGAGAATAFFYLPHTAGTSHGAQIAAAAGAVPPKLGGASPQTAKGH